MTASTDARATSRPWTARAACVLAGAALLYLYGVTGNAEEVAAKGHSAIRWMVERWSGAGGDLSHGWLIPLVSGYVVWRRRAALRAAGRQPMPAGMILVAACLLMHAVGYRAQLTRLSLFSLVGLTWTIPLALCGPAFARHLVFPCAYLVFCVPLSFLDTLTVPLRAFMSAVTTALLNGLGIAAVRHGTMIESLANGGFKIDVADPCSGLRSLLAMTALAAVYAVFTQRTLIKQWLLFLAAVPMAVLGNIARILAIAIVAQGFGQDVAVGFYHDYSGYVVFIVAILSLAGFGRLLDRIPRPGVDAPTGGVRGTAPASTPAPARARGTPPLPAVACGLLAGLTVITTAAFLAMPPVLEIADTGVADDLPARVGIYTGVDVLFCQNDQCMNAFDVPALADPTVCPTCGAALDPVSLGERRSLPKDTRFLKKRYDAPGQPPIFVSIVISGADQRSIHRPQQCLPAQGGTIEAHTVVSVPRAGDDPLRVAFLALRRGFRDRIGMERQIDTRFAYWFVSPRAETPFTLERLALTARERILHGRNYRWAYVAVFTDADPRTAQPPNRRIESFISELAPAITRRRPAGRICDSVHP